MRQRRVETRKPGVVSRIINGVEVREEQAEITLKDADPLYGRLRIVNFLADEKGNKQRLKEGDGVDVVVSSSQETETD